MKYNYEFNSLNELTQVVEWTYNSHKHTWSSSMVGQYSYDANGVRAKTVEGSYTTESVYLGTNPICDKSGTACTDYIYADGGLKVKLVGGEHYFYFDDTLGNPWVVWYSGAKNAAFTVKTYSPFGTLIVSTGTEKFGYAGEIRDSAAGASPGYTTSARRLLIGSQEIAVAHPNHIDLSRVQTAILIIIAQIPTRTQYS